MTNDISETKMTGRASVVIQARMGSTRLPGKSMADLSGRPLLAWSVARLRRAPEVAQVIVATTSRSADDPIADAAAALQVEVIRGDELNVLSRFVQAAQVADHEILIRATADCPLVDPDIASLVVQCLVDGNLDYVGTDIDGRFPHGLDLEAFTVPALLEAAPLADEPAHFEHVAPSIYQRPDRFAVGAVRAPAWAARPELRLTVDEPADLEFVRQLVALAGPGAIDLSARAFIDLIDETPDLAAINSGVTQKASPAEGYRRAPE